MGINQELLEITGSPAQVWGNILVPAKGTINVEINNLILHAKANSGLEKKDSWIPIQSIDSVEIVEAPIYWLLSFGVLLILLGLTNLTSIFGLILIGLGIGVIVFILKKKRRCLVIYSSCHTTAVFMNKPKEIYQQFAMNVLDLKLTQP